MTDEERSGRSGWESAAGDYDIQTAGRVSAPLTAEQIAMLTPDGEVRPTAAGEVLFREGDLGYDFIVILAGRVMIVDHQAGVERELASGGQGEFIAELGLLTGERLFTSAVVREPGAVLILPVARLQALISQDQDLGEQIVQTLFARRQWLHERQTGLRIIGSRSVEQTRSLLEFAARNRLPHIWLDPDADRTADVVLASHSISHDQLPIVVMRGGEVLRRPSNAELARAAGIGTGPVPGKTYDAAIIGAGPAGLAAAVYGASEGLSTALVEALAVGGQIGTTSRIENYLGFPVGISGEDFAERAFIQVLRFGASIVLPASAVGLSADDAAYHVRLDTGEVLTTRTVVVASGVSYRSIDAAGLDQFTGLGVYYTPLAPPEHIRRGEPVVIVGGGNSAGQAALALEARGHHVTIVIRGTDLTATMSHYLIERIADRPAIQVRNGTAVCSLSGEGRLERVEIEETTTKQRQVLPAVALFVLVGAEPHTDWLAEAVVLDEAGYVVTGPDLGADVRHQPPWAQRNRDPYLLETSLPGVFAAGDTRSGSVKRVAAAVGEGSIAIRFVTEYLGHRTGLAPSGVPGRPG
jgi:thioredoxin reductase (NADPH)